MKSFTLSDFGGGLNTSVDESLLPPNMSADIRNADILDSRAIRRRQGYRDHTDAIGSKVLALHRFYRTDGEKYWVAIADSAPAYGEGIVTEQTTNSGTRALTASFSGEGIFVQLTQRLNPITGTISTLSFDIGSIAFSPPYAGSPLDARVEVLKNSLVQETLYITATVGTNTIPEGYISVGYNPGDTAAVRIRFDGIYYFTVGIAYANGAYDGALTQEIGTGLSAGDDLVFSVGGTGSEVPRATAFVSQDVGTEVPTTTLEAEDATYTGTATDQSWGGFSGGAALGVTSATFSLPKHSKLTVHGKFGIGASLNIGSGYVTATGIAHTFTGLSATARTLAVKGGSRDSTRLKMEAVDANQSSYCTRTRDIPTGVGTVSVKFWDNGIASYEVFRTTEVACGGLYVGKTDSGSHYEFGTQSLFSRSGKSTGVARSAGWHTVTFRRAGTALVEAWIDGTSIPVTSSQATTIAIRSHTGADTSGYTWDSYFDTYREDYALKDDFAATSGWTATETFNATAQIASSGADTERLVYIDSFTYSALSDYQAIAALSASADTFGITTLNNRVYFGSAYDSIRYTNGVTASATTASGTTYPAFLVENKRRLFQSGKHDDTSLLNYTAVDAPNDWTGGGSIRLAGKDGGGECSGLVVWDNVLFYFAPSRIYALDTTGADSDWVSKTLHTRYGCVAPRSLVSSANGVVFLSDDGVRAYGYIPQVSSDDGSGIVLLSDNISPTIVGITNKSIAAGAVYKNRYWLSCALDGASENNAILVCDLDKRTENNQPVWTKYDIAGVTCFETTRGDEYGLYGGTENGTIIQLDYGDTDNGVAIPMRYAIPPIPAGGYHTVKHFRHLHTLGESDTRQYITITPETDDVSGQGIGVTLTPETARQPARSILAARGRYIKATIESDGANQPVTLSSLTFTYRPDPRMR